MSSVQVYPWTVVSQTNHFITYRFFSKQIGVSIQIEALLYPQIHVKDQSVIMTRTLAKGLLTFLLHASTVRPEKPHPFVLDAPSFPSAQTLSAFNESVAGALIKIQPYGQACYSPTYDAVACRVLAEQKGNDTYRSSLPGELAPAHHQWYNGIDPCPHGFHQEE